MTAPTEDRTELILDLLEDPNTWRLIAQHAHQTRTHHDRRSTAWGVLTRLHEVAADIAEWHQWDGPRRPYTPRKKPAPP